MSTLQVMKLLRYVSLFIPTTCDTLHCMRGAEIIFPVSAGPSRRDSFEESEPLRSQQEKCSGRYEQSSGVGESLEGVEGHLYEARLGACKRGPHFPSAQTVLAHSQLTCACSIVSFY
jgi:hypothetical protein